MNITINRTVLERIINLVNAIWSKQYVIADISEIAVDTTSFVVTTDTKASYTVNFSWFRI